MGRMGVIYTRIRFMMLGQLKSIIKKIEPIHIGSIFLISIILCFSNQRTICFFTVPSDIFTT